MIRRLHITLPALAAGLLLHAGLARAQMGPSPMPTSPGGPGGAGGGEPPKHEGIAEAAPKTPGLLPTTPTLPPPKSHRKRLQVLGLDGYFRVRSNWFRNFNLGFNDNPALGGAPFPRALGCSADPTVVVNAPCASSLSDLNMRLRLEPVVNIDETTSVHAQIDILDNQILGGTPVGTYLNGAAAPGNIPLGAFANGSAVPVAGLNDSRDSIVVKRAWAEAGTPLGLLMFGRMPDAWGLGILHNSGGEDPVNGGYDLDGDYGDSLDRVSFAAPVPGTRLKAMIAADWPNSRLTSTQTASPIGAQSGQALDLEDNDDVSQYSVAVSRMDTPTEFKDAVDRGETVLNWGVYAQQRTQDWDESGSFKLGAAADQTVANSLVPRNYKAYVFDPWVKLGVGGWLLEGEGVGVFGTIGTVADYCAGSTTQTCYDKEVNIRQFGGVARATYRAVEGKLRVGIETGYASGDQYDHPVQGETNIATARLIPAAGDNNITQFIFDPDYKVDLILFRHLIGAVTNALYFKPKLEYDLTKNFVFRLWNVTSFAARPVSTPGNGQMYGLEFDGDLGYQSPAFFAGFSSGALFPLGALSHPQDAETTDGPGFKYDPTNQGDASTAYTIQMRMVVKF